jgi:methylenetetrahydrofolate reductase (NADPH)
MENSYPGADDMKVTDMWASKGKPTISFEFFPPRSDKQAETLVKAIDKLAALEPDFVSVTFGAGGSTRQGSYRLAEKLKKRKDLEVMAYFAGYGLGPADIDAVLEDYASLGVENILVVRGDPPKEGDFQPHPDSFPHASDLLAYLRPRYGFCLGAAGYPEGHIEAPSRDKDIEYLRLKIAQGAEYIIANYFYDNRFFFDFLDRCGAAGITVPIVPGIMPIYSVKMLEMLANLCGATITEQVREGLAALPEDDKDALLDFGVEFALGQCRELLEAGVPGLHIYTMDRSRSPAGIVNRLRENGLL